MLVDQKAGWLADEQGSAYIMYLQLTGLGLAWLKIGSEQFAALVAFWSNLLSIHIPVIEAFKILQKKYLALDH